MASPAIQKQYFTVMWPQPEQSVPIIGLRCHALRSLPRQLLECWDLLVSWYIWGVKWTCFHQLNFWKSIPYLEVDRWLRVQNKPSGDTLAMFLDKSSDPEAVFYCYMISTLVFSTIPEIGLLRHALRFLPRQLLASSCEQIHLGEWKELVSIS